MSRRDIRPQAEQNRRSKRLEPSIGHIELEIDPAVRAQARSAARWRRFRRELVNWLLVICLFLLLVAGCVGAAVYFGQLQYPEDFASMNLPSVMILGGIAVYCLALLTGAVLAFQTSLVAGWLSLLVPGYLFYCLKRDGSYWPVVGGLLLGATLALVGLWLLA
ncbi:hypothetical protein [Dokdonella sp.]|uniref:hypothetical protein n=1 Tax=Dokdonella sp. TaxID=2291710 RepID=UPI0035280458